MEGGPVGTPPLARWRLQPLELTDARIAPATGAATAAAVCLAVAALGAANGGYFPTTWGWSSLALLWTAAIALLVGVRERPSSLEAGFLGCLGGLTAWVALSTLWSPSPTRTLLELQRASLYPAGALALLLVARRRRIPSLLGGGLAGITGTCAYGLATRLFPERLGSFDPIAGYRLAEPIGYWNALGILAAMGTLLAIGLAGVARSTAARAGAAASAVLLAVTLYFTFSRGAWIALALGLCALFALDPRRLRLAITLVALVPAIGLGVWLAAGSPALTRIDTELADASRQGHRLALAIAALAAAAALTMFILARAERTVTPGRRARLVFVSGLAAVALAGMVALFLRFGGPAELAERAYAGFTGPPAAGVDLNERLFSLSGNGRPELWRAALEQYAAEPLLGAGAGTYERFWLERRPIALKVRDAHSLYVETLAELGPLGLTLVLLVLGLPTAAAFRARRQPLVPVAFAALVAYVLHAGGDWDWEMPAVTLAALLCGAACLLGARGDHAQPLARRPRLGLLALIVALVPLAAAGLLGAAALDGSRRAAAEGNWPQAETEARRSTRLAPWSSEPLRALGEAQLAQGDVEGARASFERAIAKDRGDWQLWLDLARVTEGGEQLRALATAERLNPLSPEIAQFRAEAAVLGAGEDELLMEVTDEPAP